MKRRYIIAWNIHANGNRVFMNELNEVKTFRKSNKKLIEMVQNGIDGVRLIEIEKGKHINDILIELDCYGTYTFTTSRIL